MSLDRQWHNHRLTLQSHSSKSAGQEDQGRNDFKLRLGGGVGRVVGAGGERGTRRNSIEADGRARTKAVSSVTSRT